MTTIIDLKKLFFSFDFENFDYLPPGATVLKKCSESETVGGIGVRQRTVLLEEETSARSADRTQI